MTTPASAAPASAAPSIPLRRSSTTTPARPGMRPAGARPTTPPRSTPQNAFVQALAQAQAQNPSLRASFAQPGAQLASGQQAGLPYDFQAMAQSMTAISAAPAAVSAPAVMQVPGGFGPLVMQAAHKYGVEPALIAAVMETESKFNPDAVSQAGARGLMQLMPATARGLGVTDASDPLQNILGGAKLLGQMLDKYNGNKELALAAYNAGSGAVDKFGGIPPYGETRKYVPLVLSAYERFRQQAGAA